MTNDSGVGRDGLAAYEALRRHSRRRAQAKGQRLERLVQAALEAEGAKVERAPKIVRWRPPDEPGGRPQPFTTHHDFFGCADLLAIFPDGRRALVQVTTLTNVAARRVKFLQSGLRLTPDDAILAQEHGRRFRELRGPDFAMPGRVLVLPPLPRRAKPAKPVRPVEDGELWLSGDGGVHTRRESP